MAVFRVDKTKDYVVMSNYHLRDKNLTLKAKGLLSWMLSNTEGWDYSVAGIVEVMKENRDAINSALTELEDYGYLTRRKIRDGGKFGGVEYLITEKPFTENPITVNPITVNPTTEKPQQINTNINNNQTKKNSLPKGKEGTAPKLSYNSIFSAPENEVIKDALVKFVNSCKGRNYNPKVTTVDRFAKTLRENSGGSREVAMLIVDQSIDRGWKDLYPLKDKYKAEAVSKKFTGETAKDEQGKELVY